MRSYATKPLNELYHFFIISELNNPDLWVRLLVNCVIVLSHLVLFTKIRNLGAYEPWDRPLSRWKSMISNPSRRQERCPWCWRRVCLNELHSRRSQPHTLPPHEPHKHHIIAHQLTSHQHPSGIHEQVTSHLQLRLRVGSPGRCRRGCRGWCRSPGTSTWRWLGASAWLRPLAATCALVVQRCLQRGSQLPPTVTEGTEKRVHGWGERGEIGEILLLVNDEREGTIPDVFYLIVVGFAY